MGKLEKVKIELDETDTKLFPKPKKAKSNFGKTISKPRKNMKTNRKEDVKNIKQGASQAPKVIAVTGLIAVFMAWIVDRYPSDLVPTFMAGMLSLVAAYVLLKNN